MMIDCFLSGLCSISALRKIRPVSWQGDPFKALNSELVSAAMATSILVCFVKKYSKSEPSITHFMVSYGESILGSENPLRVCVEISALKNEASEKLGFSLKGGCPSLLCFASYFAIDDQENQQLFQINNKINK